MSAGQDRGVGINRISHIWLNASDLRASTDFYSSATPLRPLASGEQVVTDGTALGLDSEAAFSWRSLSDGTTGDPVRLVLAEWKRPGLVGEPYEDVADLGILKFAFHHSDPEATLARMDRLGLPPTNETIVRGYVTVLDPDRTIVSFRHTPEAPIEQLFHVYISTGDIGRYLDFCDEVLGLEYWMNSTPDSPRPTSQGPGGDIAQWNSHFMRHPSDRRFTLDIGQFVYPEPHGEPHGAANAVGLAMIGFEVDDLDATAERLAERMSGWTDSSARTVGGIVDWFDTATGEPTRALHATDPDGNILQFVERRIPQLTRPTRRNA